MKPMLVRQALLLVGVVLVGGALLSLVFRAPGDRNAVWISGAVAVVVQLVAFSLARVAGAGAGLSARLAVGALLRLVALAIYATVVVALKLPATAALVSLAAFFLVSSMVEPLLVK